MGRYGREYGRAEVVQFPSGWVTCPDCAGSERWLCSSAMAARPPQGTRRRSRNVGWWRCCWTTRTHGGGIAGSGDIQWQPTSESPARA